MLYGEFWRGLQLESVKTVDIRNLKWRCLDVEVLYYAKGGSKVNRERWIIKKQF
jgi:hypothetical protein